MPRVIGKLNLPVFGLVQHTAGQQRLHIAMNRFHVPTDAPRGFTDGDWEYPWGPSQATALFH